MKIENIDNIDISNINDNIDIEFSDNLSHDDIICIFKKILDFEIDKNKNFKYSFKGLPVDVLVDIFRIVIKNENVKNPILITNLILLLKNYNSLDDSFFESKNVFVSSLEDFLDLKTELKPEIREFNTRIAIYHISCMNSLNKFEYSFIDNPIEIPTLYKTVMMSVDVFTLSSIMSNTNEYSSKDMVLVKNAFHYITELAVKTKIMDNMFKFSLNE